MLQFQTIKFENLDEVVMSQKNINDKNLLKKKLKRN